MISDLRFFTSSADCLSNSNVVAGIYYPADHCLWDNYEVLNATAAVILPYQYTSCSGTAAPLFPSPTPSLLPVHMFGRK